MSLSYTIMSYNFLFDLLWSLNSHKSIKLKTVNGIIIALALQTVFFIFCFIWFLSETVVRPLKCIDYYCYYIILNYCGGGRGRDQGLLFLLRSWIYLKDKPILSIEVENVLLPLPSFQKHAYVKLNFLL